MSKQTQLLQLQRQIQTALRSNHLPAARELLTQATKLDKKNPDTWFLLGAVCGALGDPREAVRCGQTAVKLQPGSAEGHYNLGMALQTLSRYREAAEAFGRALKLKPNYAAAHLMLGNCLMDLGQTEAAIDHYIHSLKLDPSLHAAYYNLGKAAAESIRNAEIRELLRNTVEQNDKSPAAHLGLAILLRQNEEILEAIKHARRAVELAPQWAPAYAVLGDFHNQDYCPELAEPAFRKALELEPESIPHRLGLAKSLLSLDRSEEASDLVSDAYACMPDNPNVIQAVADSKKKQGQHDEAIRYYRKLLETDPPQYGIYMEIANAKKFSEKAPEISEIEELISRQDHPAVAAEASLRFALGKLYGDAKYYDESFTNYAKGNALFRKKIDYDTCDTREEFDRIIQFFDEEFFSRNQFPGVESELPVFIVGMPRSGTTLTETILSSHPLVHAAGELNDINVLSHHMARKTGMPPPEWIASANPEYLTGVIRMHLDKLSSLEAGILRVTDKLPHNFINVGIIRYLYPMARIIHVQRHPLDNCLSIFFQDFNPKHHPYAWELRELGAYYREYRRLMAHWRKVIPGPYLEIQYEKLVESQEEATRQLIEFCGLEWDDRCLNFHQSKRTVETASHWQVRQPIYKTSKERWRRYEAHLQPLMEAIDLDTLPG